MDYISIAEAAEQRGVTRLRVQALYNESRMIDVFEFNVFRRYLPNLEPLREFVTDDSCVGYSDSIRTYSPWKKDFQSSAIL